MKLYDCSMAPNARRVRIFLAEKGIVVPSVQVDIMAGENLQADYLAVSPRGLVPALQLDDGSVLDESIAICRYIEASQGGPTLFGGDAKSSALIDARQRQVEFDGLLPLADIVRNATPAFSSRGLPGRTEVAAIPALVERGMVSFQLFLSRLNNLLEGSEYLAGGEFSVADITALCVVDFARAAKISIPDHHANTLAWYQRVSSRPSASA